ncbi:MAG: CBS domain-containing protein [Rhodospirillales bacterium]|nr:CBS domain-containing protein [Rhodospirillales bacterium]
MYVSDILKKKGAEVIAIGPGEPVAAALALMQDKKVGAVLVLNEDRSIAGILSERDLVLATNRLREKVFEKRVSELMTTKVVTCSSREPVCGIMGMMTAQRFRHVPVVDNGQLVGVVSIGDVVKSRIEEAESEVEALRRYIVT